LDSGVLPPIHHYGARGILRFLEHALTHGGAKQLGKVEESYGRREAEEAVGVVLEDVVAVDVDDERFVL